MRSSPKLSELLNWIPDKSSINASSWQLTHRRGAGDGVTFGHESNLLLFVTEMFAFPLWLLFRDGWWGTALFLFTSTTLPKHNDRVSHCIYQICCHFFCGHLRNIVCPITPDSDDASPLKLAISMASHVNVPDIRRRMTMRRKKEDNACVHSMLCIWHGYDVVIGALQCAQRGIRLIFFFGTPITLRITSGPL